MRLDKFLKVSRLVKRRSVARQFCDAGRVSLNGNTGKPATRVEVGDEIGVDFGWRRILIRVREVRDGVPAKEAAAMYQLISEEKIRPDEVPSE